MRKPEPTISLTVSSDRSGVMLRQLTSFVGVGLLATACHYSVLIALVQLAKMAPVPATLVGFCVGGCVSYILNRRHTFSSDRPHDEAAWRFAIVAVFAFGLTFLFMRVMVERWLWNYLIAQVLTTGLVMIWTFTANKAWTFGPVRA